MPLFSQRYFLRETGDGRRLISWRVWVLVWVAPALFALAFVVLLGEAAYKRLATVPGEGEVVRVYAWEGETWFDRGTTNYAPVLRYVWSDGKPTEASTGMSHPDWNFEIGSRHMIRYFPGAKADLVLPGAHNWSVAWVIGAIAAVLLLPALWGTWRLKKWQAGGRR
ncbi:hypothetical protein PGB28_18035 [Primorskyibacter aestuariivivens]|uniref:DUF3592 domain-containing protein n=1 Tax=Primorskyibacter aestuariivivens TaxID=1888912 RepID=UPI00230184DE|nr:DUF3592 domain-containing protein [Primorskyibacter aestuariivivens]MDA7430365.1 hypothetical protein [Primorskyibacter aestuariivivens]